jgi:hypothetical protein
MSRPLPVPRRLQPRILLASCLALASLGLSARVWATPNYPNVLNSGLGVDCPSPNSRCLICHSTARGGQTTAVQPFAQSLRKYGLDRGYADSVLADALKRLPDDTDSDGDGTPDKEELMRCGNPSGEDLGDGPEYGCDGAHLAATAGSRTPLVVFSILLAGLLVRPRRRR